MIDDRSSFQKRKIMVRGHGTVDCTGMTVEETDCPIFLSQHSR